ncbi:MAG TPA: 2-C-methyl-D-erythritol 2,4-cyclodiphosphate synthase [Clostridiaceae bacterium]|jgi:2-C-methyl-D-erythritol 2,4-cyclodiphosphate synthase|nr:2-C-methyl-D-erythritol 2,4-cyclodiphosphate synthase [Clostridiaceae bacterium]
MKVGIGQDSHRFDLNSSAKKLVLGGVVFEGYPGLEGNSDADVILHAITNAISGVTCVNILGEIADRMCRLQGITDSSEYVREAMKYLGENKIVHLSVSIECLEPKISPKIPQIRESLSKLLDIPPDCIGITATTGEGLTGFGRGEGIQAFCCITVV